MPDSFKAKHHAPKRPSRLYADISPFNPADSIFASTPTPQTSRLSSADSRHT